MTNEIPDNLLAELSPEDVADVHAWWAVVAEPDRVEVIALCSWRVRHSDDPMIRGGRFVPSDDAAGWSEWREAQFEYLIAHPDRVADEPIPLRTFYIGGLSAA